MFNSKELDINRPLKHIKLRRKIWLGDIPGTGSSLGWGLQITRHKLVPKGDDPREGTGVMRWTTIKPALMSPNDMWGRSLDVY